jgi:hypothetical protein
LIPRLRERFNCEYSANKYAELLRQLEERCGSRVEFRVAETPVFLERRILEEMAKAGSDMCCELMGDETYLQAARRAIPAGYCVAGETRRPHFLTADFGLVREPSGGLKPRLVEIQAFPSVYAYQAVLNRSYVQAYGLDENNLGWYLDGLDRDRYWELLSHTVLGGHDPINVVLTEIDPLHQKTLPDFDVTAKKLGIAVVDIRALQAVGNKLHYRNAQGKLIPIDRIYNRAIVDELMARNIKLPFDLTKRWDVEWAGHPNWYFLISKFSIPWLTRKGGWDHVVPPAVFLNDFMSGEGRRQLEKAGVDLPAPGPDAVYSELLLKPLFSFAGRGIQFEPTQAQLEAIPADQRKDYLLQQRMRFEPTIETPFGLTQAEIRILYMWPERGTLRPALSLVRLGRGKMMGVDHNRNQEWVGGSAAFFPKAASSH